MSERGGAGATDPGRVASSARSSLRSLEERTIQRLRIIKVRGRSGTGARFACAFYCVRDYPKRLDC